MSKVTEMTRKIRFEKCSLGLSKDVDNLGEKSKRNFKTGTKCFPNNNTVFKSHAVCYFRNHGFCQVDNL